jgi:CheY-like chemotaxis protein
MTGASVRLLFGGGSGATLEALQAHCAHGDIVVIADSAAALDILHGRGAYSGPGPVRPRVIVLDMAAQSIAAVSALKADADTRTIPLVVFCDSGDVGMLDACYRAGANACVVRPAAGAELQNAAGALVAFWLDANEVLPSAD